MDGVKSGESGAFLLSRRVSDFCDGRRSFPTNENSDLYSRGRRRWISLFYQSLSQINMASLENTSDCCLESLAQEGRKNDMVFLVGFCLSRIEILALTSERTQMYWERRSISSCASMLLYKYCYICGQDWIFGALSISARLLKVAWASPYKRLKFSNFAELLISSLV